MKLKSALTALVFISALSACAPKSEEAATEAMDQKVAVDLIAPPSKASNSDAPIAVSALPQLAYDYQYRFSASKPNIEALIAADQAMCDKAGTGQCQLISLSSDSYNDENMINRTLDLRVSPAWLKAYQGNLSKAVKAHHARISNQTVTSEDLSLEIVDTEARIKNKEALRDRLQSIIKSGNGKVAELIEAETQLANTQAEIDSAKSQLLVMQKRVATIHLTLTYQSEAVAASNGTFAPIKEALRSSLGNMMGMVGFLISLFSYNLPLIIIGIPAFIYGRKWWLKRKTTKPTKLSKE